MAATNASVQQGTINSVVETDSGSGQARILASAVKAFSRDGYSGASMRRIAAEAGVDAALIYHRFGSKDLLWRACVDQVAGIVLSNLDAPSGQQEDLLESVVGRLVDLVCEQPVIARFILSEISSQDERFDYVRRVLIDNILSALRKVAGDTPAHEDPIGEIRLLAIAGAITTTVICRPFLESHSPSVIDRTQFRSELKSLIRSLLDAKSTMPASKSGIRS